MKFICLNLIKILEIFLSANTAKVECFLIQGKAEIWFLKFNDFDSDFEASNYKLKKKNRENNNNNLDETKNKSYKAKIDHH